MPVLTKINTNSIAEDAITGDKFAGDAYLANTATQNISGTYSENRLYTSDAYTLSGNATVNSNLTLSSVKPTGDVVLTADGARTITGTGVLSGGSLLAKTRSDLTGMTGELGSVVTGGGGLTNGSSLTSLGTVTSGTLGSDVTGGSGLEISELVGIAYANSWNTATNYVTLASNKKYDVIAHWHSKAQFTYYILGIDRWILNVDSAGTVTQDSAPTGNAGGSLDMSTANAVRVNALDANSRPSVVYVFERGLTMDVS